MKNACFSNCKDEQNRSSKDCVCGGHNASNPKRNLHHNSTRKRLSVKTARKLKEILDNIEDIDPDFSKTVDDHFWELF